MKHSLPVIAFSILSLGQAFALGPIPNGTYSGTMSCSNQYGNSIPDQVVTITIADSAMTFGASRKEFIDTGKGFFKVRHYDTSNPAKGSELSGIGHGYFTATGVHINMMIDVGVAVAEGEDTFVYRDGRVILVSSAGGYKCEGEFRKKDSK